MFNSMKLSLVALGGLALVAACSSSTKTDSTDVTPTEPVEAGAPAKPAPTAPSGSSGSSGSSGTSGSSGSSGSTNPDDACAAETSQAACGQCCVTGHSAGYQVFLSAVLACACTGTGGDAGAGVCATECAGTACKATPSQPDTACTTCLQGAIAQNGACGTAVSQACTADKDCVAEQKCLTPCQSKK
jgi:hypothetical protein